MTEERPLEPGDEGVEPGADQGRAGGDVSGAMGDGASLEALRERILDVDEALVRLVGERRQLVLDIGRRKAESGQPVMDPSREATVVRRAAQLARDEGIDEEMVRDVVWRIIASARDEQEGRTSWGPPSALDPHDDPPGGEAQDAPPEDGSDQELEGGRP